MSKQLTRRSTELLAPQMDFILMDGSSSMAQNWWPMIGALTEWRRKLLEHHINSHGIVATFSYSNNLQNIQRDGRIADWTPLGGDERRRDALGLDGGMTALYDAINMMGRTMRDYDPPSASLLIVTDGEENASRHTDDVQARAILDWCRAKGWQVTFFGCDFDNSKQAASLGATERNTIGVRSQKLLEAGRTLGEKRVRNAISGSEIQFTDEEKEAFGGYLTGPSSK